MLTSLVGGVCEARAEWPMARGNAQRTGCVDRRPGPTKPKVVWAFKTQEHFIGSPVPFVDRLYAPGLGTFNTGTFHCFSTATETDQRVLWSKAAPFLKRPTVCSPAIAEGLVVLGDGMHQTDDAILYCLRADTGRMLWQYAVPGKLIHIEASPLIHGDRVYFGAGQAGVFSVQLKQMTLDGKDYDLEAAQTLLEERGKALQAKYDEEKKKDPDFAVPPTEDALPKLSPKLDWQAGKDQWHVDAPLALAGNRLLVSSAYLDEDKCGKRALICLRTDGKPAWEVPLTLNPWAGATVIDGYNVLVGCSSVRYDPKLLKDAKGEVLLVRGGSSSPKVQWRKELPGGVLSPIAYADGLAVFTATDGKVRAWNAATGEEKWAVDCGAPFFAGVAITRGTAYAADLNGVVHAIDLALGKELWSLKLQADPFVQSPGMVYGSPVVHGGRVYLGTCNVEGAHADQPGAIVCIADEAALEFERAALIVSVDKAKGTASVPCRIASRKLPHLKEIYPIEVMATHPYPRGEKAHETVVTVLAKPSDVHKAMEEMGLKPGKPAKGEGAAPEGPEVRISLAVPLPGGGEQVMPLEQALTDDRTGKQMPAVHWFFTGSAMKQPDPEKPVVVYGADFTGTLISLFPITDYTVFQSDLTLRDEGLLRMETNKVALPREHSPARLIIELVAEQAAQAPGPLDTARRLAGPLPPLPPLLTEPVPAAAYALVPLAGETDPPPLPVHQIPWRLAEDGLRPLPPLPLADRPPLATCTRPLTKAPVPMGVGPLVQEDSPDINRLPQIRLYLNPYTRRADPADDPTRGPTQRVLFSAVPTGRTESAPYHRLAIPDPFEQVNAVRLREQPPDADPPTRDRQLPDLPDMPVHEDPNAPAEKAG